MYLKTGQKYFYLITEMLPEDFFAVGRLEYDNFNKEETILLSWILTVAFFHEHERELQKNQLRSLKLTVFIFTRQWKLLTLVFTANLCTTLLLSFCYCRCLRMPVLLLPKPSGNIWTCILRGGRGPESRSYDVGPLDQARNCASDEP